MLSSGIIDLAIGLAFIFGVTAALASVITEMIARFLGLRGAYLLLGLRELLDSKGTPVVLRNAERDFCIAMGLAEGDPPPATSALLGSPILSSQGMTGTIASRQLTVDAGKVKATKKAEPEEGKPAEPGGGNPAEPRGNQVSEQASPPKRVIPFLSSWKMRRSLPSYISSRSFTEAVIGMVVPDESGRTSMNGIQKGIENLPVLPGPLKDSLRSLAASANGDIDRFRTSIENWYDDHMDRVSGWYKRRTAWITFGVGLVLVVLLNINALTIGHALYGDSAARTAVSSLAAQGNPCPVSQNPTDQDKQKCLEGLESRVSAVAQSGLPIGWATVPACAKQGAHCDWLAQRGITNHDGGSGWQVVLVLIGFVITIAALTPGAQFWFGLVVKLNSLRSTGPPPATSGTSAK